MGARHVARRLRRLHLDGDRHHHRRDAGSQPLEQRLRRPGRLCRSGGPAERLDRGPHRVPRPQRQPCRACGPSASAAALSGRTGAGFDPCAALKRRWTWTRARSVEVVFFIGQCSSAEEARSPGRPLPRDRSRRRLRRRRRRIGARCSGAVQVRTPDRAMDIMLNGWLLYQTIACRIWARSAFYQASGAYGFRDQLQDGMALTFAQPGRDAQPSAAGGLAAVRRRRRAALVAAPERRRACGHGSRMIVSGSPSRPPPTSRARATLRCWTKSFRSWTGRHCVRASTTRSSSLAPRTNRPRCSSIARADWTSASS